MRPLLDVAAPGSIGMVSTSYGTQMIKQHRLRHAVGNTIHQRLWPSASRTATQRLRPASPPLSAYEDHKVPNGDTDESAPSRPSALAPEDGRSSPSTSSEDDTALRAELGSVWEVVKRDIRQGLNPEDAQVLDSIKVDDLMGDSRQLMQKIADEQLGPLLCSLGLSDDPLDFFLDLLRLGTGLQLLSTGVLFYGAELLGGCDSGEAFRCVCGLATGYLSRPFFKVELLLWPLYDWGLRLLSPGAVYQVSGSPGDVQSTLTRLGVAMAVCSLLPRVLWDWDTTACLQFVVPLAAGWLLFDVAYMAALLVKLQR